MAADTDLADRTLVITRTFDAPRALVFRLWTQPEHVARWWGPQGFVTTFCDMDIRVGGCYRFGMRAPDGTEYRKRGIYHEIVEPERIVFTFAWEDEQGRPKHELLTTVTFHEADGRTRLTLRQEVFETVAGRDDHRAGWVSCLERFAAYIATV
ncbi:MAG TPA: SRPBCC domain-containing protein [Rhodopila sp.]|nr:SRPBCC domain-containing protein [Rhodopila sp.]